MEKSKECLLVLHGIICPKVCKDMSLNAVGLSSCWRYICNHWYHLEWFNVLLGRWLWILLWQQLLSLVEQILQACLGKRWWRQLCPCCLPHLLSLDFPCPINTSTPLPLHIHADLFPICHLWPTKSWAKACLSHQEDVSTQPNGRLQSDYQKQLMLPSSVGMD